MPPLTPRDAVKALVNDNATRTRRNHQLVWNDLYKEFGYRKNFDVKKAAYNAGFDSTIEYMEQAGHMPELLNCAKDYLKPALPESEKENGTLPGPESKE